MNTILKRDKHFLLIENLLKMIRNILFFLLAVVFDPHYFLTMITVFVPSGFSHYMMKLHSGIFQLQTLTS
jgi:hypothetical protein